MADVLPTYFITILTNSWRMQRMGSLVDKSYTAAASNPQVVSSIPIRRKYFWKLICFGVKWSVLGVWMTLCDKSWKCSFFSRTKDGSESNEIRWPDVTPQCTLEGKNCTLWCSLSHVKLFSKIYWTLTGFLLSNMFHYCWVDGSSHIQGSFYLGTYQMTSTVYKNLQHKKR